MQILNHWTRSYVFSAYLVKFQEIYMDFTSDRILHLNCQWTGDFFLSTEQYAQFQLPRKIVAHYVVKFLYIFKEFTAAEFLHLGWIQHSFGLFYQEKEAEFLHGKKIIFAYVVEVQQFFMDFTSCRNSASVLNPVNFWSILTIE